MADRKKELEKGKKLGQDIVKKPKLDLPKPKGYEGKLDKLEKAQETGKDITKTVEENKQKRQDKWEEDVKKNVEEARKLYAPENVAQTAINDVKPDGLGKDIKKSQETVRTSKEEIPLKEEEYKLPENDVSEILSDEQIMGTDEGQAIQKSIETGDLTPAMDIVDPNTGKPILRADYSENGDVRALEPLVPDNSELYTKGTAIALTLISVAASAISGGMVPPINFMQLRWDEAKNREAELKNEVLRILNKETDVYNQNLLDIRATEGRLASAYNNPELYGRDNTNALARAEAAKQGNIGLETLTESQGFEKWRTEYTGELQKELQRIANKFQLDLTDKLYRQQCQQLIDTIAYAKKEGYTNDQIAKYISSSQGFTNLARGFQYAGQLGQIINEVGTGIGSALYGPGKGGVNINTAPQGGGYSSPGQQRAADPLIKKQRENFMKNNRPGESPTAYEARTGEPAGYDPRFDTYMNGQIYNK